MKNTFEHLKTLLSPYEKELTIVHNKEDNYYLHTPPTPKKKKGEFFGAVQIKKNYVAFHLMPIYCNPELLQDVSEDLKKKMQGKSCFNFKEIDEDKFEELKNLVESSFNDFRRQNKV